MPDRIFLDTSFVIALINGEINTTLKLKLCPASFKTSPVLKTGGVLPE